MTLYNFCWWWEIFKFIPEIFPTLRQKIWNSKSFSSEFHVIVIHSWRRRRQRMMRGRQERGGKCHRLQSAPRLNSMQLFSLLLVHIKSTGFALNSVEHLAETTTTSTRGLRKIKFMFCAVWFECWDSLSSLLQALHSRLVGDILFTVKFQEHLCCCCFWKTSISSSSSALFNSTQSIYMKNAQKNKLLLLFLCCVFS